MPRTNFPALLVLATFLLGACSGGGDGDKKDKNTPPIAEWLLPEQAFTGTVLLEATASDAESGPEALTAVWRLDSAEVCPGASVDTDGVARCEVEIETSGNHTLALTLIDPDDAAFTLTADLDVAPYDPPVAHILEPQSGRNYYANVNVEFLGDLSDNQDLATTLSYAWASDLDGPLTQLDGTPAVTGEVMGSLKLSAGDHEISLTATDSHGLTHTATVDVTVVEDNHAPTCTFDLPAGEAYNLFDDVVFVGTANDVDVGPTLLIATVESDVAGVLGTSTVDAGGNWTLTRSNLSLGSHTLTAIIEDEVGATCEATTTVRIARRPAVSISEPNGQTVNEGQVTRFTATLSDPDHPTSALTVAWSSDVDGVFDTTPAAGALASINYGGLSQGSHLVTVLVTDPDGLTATDDTTIVINGLPSAPIIDLEPQDADTHSNLVVMVISDSTDPEFDLVTYSYQWYRNNVLFPAITGDQLTWSATSRGETWKVVVTPNDGSGDGVPAEAEVTIGNAPAEVIGLSFDPTPPIPGTDLFCDATLDDADSDPVTATYAWRVNGILKAESSDTLSGTAFVVGDTVECAVYGNDGIENGPVTAYLDIANNPPVVSSVTLTPKPALSTEDLVCTANGINDADGDTITLTYRWTVNGITQAETTNILSESAYVRDDRVVCTVTPADPLDPGLPVASLPLIVSNAPPLAPTVSIQPAMPSGQSDPLLCAIVDNGDPDGDAVDFTVDWTLNSSAWTGLTSTTVWPDDTIAAASTLNTDVWECTVTPDDGTALGPTATSTVTVGP